MCVLLGDSLPRSENCRHLRTHVILTLFDFCSSLDYILMDLVNADHWFYVNKLILFII